MTREYCLRELVSCIDKISCDPYCISTPIYKSALNASPNIWISAADIIFGFAYLKIETSVTNWRAFILHLALSYGFSSQTLTLFRHYLPSEYILKVKYSIEHVRELLYSPIHCLIRPSVIDNNAMICLAFQIWRSLFALWLLRHLTSVLLNA